MFFNLQLKLQSREGGRILRLGGPKKFFRGEAFFPENPRILLQVRLFPPRILELFPRRGFFAHKISDLSQNFKAEHKYLRGAMASLTPLYSLPASKEKEYECKKVIYHGSFRYMSDSENAILMLQSLHL